MYNYFLNFVANRKSKGSRPSSPSVDKGKSLAQSPVITASLFVSSIYRFSLVSYSGRKNGLGASRASSEEVAQLVQCEELVRDMMEKEDCWPFLQPVNKKEVRLSHGLEKKS